MEHDTCGPQGQEVSPSFSLGIASDLWRTQRDSRILWASTRTLCLSVDQGAVAAVSLPVPCETQC